MSSLANLVANLKSEATTSALSDSLYCAGQPVLLPQQVHQRCVPSLMVVKMMTKKLFHLPQQYSLFVVVVTNDLTNDSEVCGLMIELCVFVVVLFSDVGANLWKYEGDIVCIS